MSQSHTDLVFSRSAESLHAKAKQSIIENWSIKPNDLFGEMCEYAVHPTGKLFRPMLLLDASLTVSTAPDRTLPAAAGIEYAHVASLVHDDIIDLDAQRRGKETVHTRFGLPGALLVGDALIFQTFRALVGCREVGAAPELVLKAVELYATAGLDMCRGQVLEAQMAGDLGCTRDTYLEIVRLKTASLFRCAAECGAVLGGGSPEQIQLLAEYGNQLGILFQIVDDLLSYTGTPAQMGKSQTTDVKNKRLTLPIIHAYATGSAAVRERIEQVFHNVSMDSYAEIMDVLRATGAIAHAQRTAKEHAQTAVAILGSFPNSPSRGRLESYVHRALEREG